jgi:glutathione peroxidase-family protein
MGNKNTAECMNSAGEPATSIFEFEVPSITGGTVHLSEFKGKKAYIVVNVASQ